MFGEGCISRWVRLIVLRFGIPRGDFAANLAQDMMNQRLELVMPGVRLTDRKSRFPFALEAAIKARLHPIMQLRFFYLAGCTTKKRTSLSSFDCIGQEWSN